MIDRNTIARILDAANIVEVVSDFVTLRKAGVNYKGLCPFHNEKTPSFVVSPAKGYCKCFSCGKGGNVVHFIMEHEQMSYPEALRWLAKKYNIEIKERDMTPEEIQAQNKRESLFLVNEWARDYFRQILFEHPDGKAIGLTYFRQRGFRDDIIKKFQLGFCLAQRDAMAQAAIHQGYKPEYLEATGLCYKNDHGQLRDRYHGRVIFPVHTISGKVVAFGGRILNTGEKTAKYVNSPESEIYHKSNELYGLFFAKHEIVRQDRCFLVEGYTDVISMHQSGIENVVASSGTSLTSGQIRLIHRFTNNITILYDGDMAGIKASLRGIDMLLEEGLNIKVLLLPNGDDPDSFARKHNAEEYKKYIEEHQVDFIRFKTGLLMDEAEGDPIKQAQLVNDIVQSISVIPDAILRSVYIKECSQLMKMNEALLVEAINKLRKQRQKSRNESPSHTVEQTSEATTNPEQEKPEDSSVSEIQAGNTKDEETPFQGEEKLLIQAIIRYGERVMSQYENEDTHEIVKETVVEYIANEFKRDDMCFTNKLYKQIFEEALLHINDKNFLAHSYFSSHPNSEISLLACDLCGTPYLLSKRQMEQIKTDEERLYEVVPHLILDLKLAYVQQTLKKIVLALRSPEVAADSDRCLKLMKQYQQYKKIECELAKQTGERVVNPPRI